MVFIGCLLMLASIWAGQYVVYRCSEEWYAVSAIITIWAVRLVALGLIIGGINPR